MKKIFVLTILFCPLLGFAQGIAWTEALSWEQVKQKAKSQNKYIFVDVYATWCGPCKIMDRDIYPLAEVGKLYNEKFIAVRVQADQTEKDSDFVKRWYKDAEKIIKNYKVMAYPTFLFIEPDGELVHRSSGRFNEEKFIDLAKEALEQRGYTAQLESFTKGEYKNLDLKELAMTAKYAGDDSLAKVVATKYVETTDIREFIKAEDNGIFLHQIGGDDITWRRQVCIPKLEKLSIDQLANPIAIHFVKYVSGHAALACRATDMWMSTMSDKELFTKDALGYLGGFVCHSTDKSFAFFRKNASRINKIMGKKNWAEGCLDNVVINEEFNVSLFNPASKLVESGIDGATLQEPDWKALQATITVKYGAACAKRLQYIPKVSWYSLTGNKKEYTKNLVAEMDRTGGWDLGGMILNNNAMMIFMYSTNKEELIKAANWMEKYFEKNPNEKKTNASGIDTYSTLLYKAGRIKESIEWEEKAVKIDPASKEIADNLLNMRKGLPIWPKGFDVIN